MNPSERQNYIAAEFSRRFGALPTFWSRAPGRVDLMGSHTDYNQGYVMTMALNRETWLAARPRPDQRVNIYSLNLAGGGEFDLNDISHDTAAPWTNYVRGVAQVMQAEGYPLSGFDGLVHSTVPLNSGLSSSAAIEVATAEMFQRVSNLKIDPVQLALLCQRAENQFVGVNSGILDQYSSKLGQADCALLLDCRALTIQPVALPPETQVVICDTQAPRELTGSEYGERRAQCEAGARQLAQFYPGVTHLRDVSLAQFEAHAAALPEVIARRCRFIIEENERVLALARALPAADLAAIHDLMADSYRGARDLYEIGAPAMEAMIEAMQSGPGVIGARQAGAGFGGCMVAFVTHHQADAFAAHVQTVYARATGLQAKIYPVQAAAGAGPLTLES